MLSLILNLSRDMSQLFQYTITQFHFIHGLKNKNVRTLSLLAISDIVTYKL